MVVVAGAASCLLKGQLHPLGSVTRLRASPRMYPRKVQGPPRGPSLTAALQGRWVRDAASALPPSSLYFPFGSLQGWVGAGRASPPGLGSPSHPFPFDPFTGAGAAPGIPGPGMRPTPACELRSGLRRLGPGQSGEDPRGSASRCSTTDGMSPGAQVWARRPPWSPGDPRRAQRGWL